MSSMFWLPSILGLTLLGTIYVRHRKKPVGIAGWATPIAVALLLGLILAGSGFVDAVDTSVRATPMNRLRIASLQIERTLSSLGAGLLGAAIVGAVIPWLIPGGTSKGGKPRWGLELGAVAVGVLASLAVWVGLRQYFSSFSAVYYFGAVALLALGSLAIARLRASSASREGLVSAVSAMGGSVLAWVVLSRLAASALVWDVFTFATPENRQRLLASLWEARSVIAAWPAASAAVIIVLVLLVVRALLPRPRASDATADGWRVRALLAGGLVLLTAAPHFWLWSTYRDACAFVAEERIRERNPLRGDSDIDLPRSRSALHPEDMVTILIGRTKTLVAERADMRESALRVEAPADLEPKIREAFEALGRSRELLGVLNDHIATLAVDRCSDSGEAKRAMRGANSVGIERFKLLTVNEGENRVVNLCAGGTQDLSPVLELEMSATGIDVVFRGEHQPALQNCPEDGQTVCSSMSDGGQVCGESNQDWVRLGEVLVSLKAAAPDEVDVLLRVDDDVPWQSTIRLMEAAAGEPSRDGRLFAMPILELQ